MVSALSVNTDTDVSPFNPLRVTFSAQGCSSEAYKTYLYPTDAAFSLAAQWDSYDVLKAQQMADAAGALPVHATQQPGVVEVFIPRTGTYGILVVAPSNNDIQLGIFAEAPAVLTPSSTGGDLSIAERALLVPSIDDTQSSITPLTSGVPVAGSANYNQYKYFGINATIPFSRMDISVTPTSGDPDLYVTVDGTLPTTTHYQYMSTAFLGTDSVIVRQNDASKAGLYCNATLKAGKPCQIIIGVYGAWAIPGQQSAFTVVATLGGTDETALQSGVPLLDTVPAAETNYYSLAGNTQNAALLFAVTDISGDPDLYIGSSSRGMRRPKYNDPSTYCWKSTTARRDVVEVYPGDTTGCYCNGIPGCTYFIGVYAYGNADATFTVMGQENMNSTYVLIDGRPQVSFVQQGETDQYIYTVPPVLTPQGAAGQRSISITLAPFAGDPDLYVTLNGDVPGPGRWDYRALGTSGVEYITIRDSDSQVQNSPCKAVNVSCVINIAVFGYSRSLAWYQISASSGRATMLSDGMPVTDYVDNSLYRYFQFRTDYNADPQDAIIITVTPLSGDPDVFVGTSANNATYWPTVNPGSYIWHGIGTGTEVIFIDPQDPNVIACGVPCTYTIGVEGYNGNASFVILAHTRDGRPVPLVPSVPIVDDVEEGEYMRYTADYDPTQGLLEVTVTPLDGDPDLYIALDGRVVTNTNWQYAAISSTGIEDIKIRPTDRQFNVTCAQWPTNNCTASIAVYGYSQAQYSIVASNGVRSLQDGVPMDASSPGNGYTYFKFTLSNRRLLTVTVTPITNDPDLYMSNTVKTPNSTTATWGAAGFGPEVITIDPADPDAASCAFPCTYYIGVLGWRRPSTYTITASTQGITTLPAGQPVQGTAPPGGYAYFSYFAPAARTGIEFIVVPTSGAPDTTLYVSNDIDPQTGRTYYPTADAHADWTSGTSLARNEIQISPSDPAYRTRSQYIIGVYSDNGATFTITAANGNSVKVLQPGLPEQGAVTRGAYSYYRLSSSTWGAAMSVTLTPLSGDPDMYLSRNSSNVRPTSGNYDKSAVGAGTETVVFQWAELPECQANLDPNGNGDGTCSIYIGVYGYSNATYTVVGEVSFSNTSWTELVDGQPQGAIIQPGTWSYYYTRVRFAPTQTYSVYVRATGGDPDLYVTTDGMGPPTITPRHYQYVSNHASGDELIDIAPGTPGYNSSTVMVAGVYAWGSNPAQYTITYASASAVVSLQAGVAVSNFLAVGQYAYYSFSASDRLKPTTWSVTSLAGNPNIYISQWKPLQQRWRPTKNAGQYTWSGSADGSDSVTINPYPQDPNACIVACQYISGVYCAGPGNCRYTVSAVQAGAALIPLIDGQPASGRVVAGSYSYYSLSVPAGGRKNITMRVTTTLGSAQLYVTNKYDPSCQPACGALPTNSSNNYIWASSVDGGSTGSGVITIGWNDRNINQTSTKPTLFTIGVLGSGGAQTVYTIIASSAEAVTTLVPGQPLTRQVVSNNANVHYAVNLADTSSDLIVTATILSGSVTIALSSPYRDPSVYGYPGCTSPRICNATWTSVVAAQSGDTVRVFAPQGDGTKVGPCLGPYVYQGGPWPCNIQNDWAAGLWNIGVYGIGASEFTLTAFTAAGPEDLEDGQPQAGESVPGNPATFVYKSGPNLRLPDIRVLVASDVQPLSYYIRSCLEGTCQPSDSMPGPTNYEDSGNVDGGASGDIFITKYSSSYCAAPAGSVCHYYISVWPAGSSGSCTDPTDPTCTVTFTITASVQDGNAPTIINYASISNKVLSLTGNVIQRGSSLFELYLNSSAQADITMDVDACGPGYPNVYVCNPNPANNAQPCTNPFSPGPNSGGTTMSGSTSAGGGTVRLVDQGVQASTYFIAVAADQTSASTSSSKGAVAVSSGVDQRLTTWAYNIMLSSGQTYYLLPPTSNAVVISQGENGVTYNISWAPAVIGDQEKRGLRNANAATYTVYAAPGGFTGGGNPSGFIPTTACGLIRWAALTKSETIGPTPRGSLSVEVTGLLPNTYYEFAVVAQCDRVCFGSTSVEAAAAAESEEQQVGAPGYVTQWVAYGVSSTNTGSASGPPTEDAFPVAGIVGIVAGAAAIIGAAGACFYYKRGKLGDMSYQYNSLDVSSAMATISTPVDDHSGSIQAGPPARGAGAGFLSSLRSMISSATARKQGFDGVGTGLAEAEYSSIEDKVAGYL